jgi:hypothetical protein
MAAGCRVRPPTVDVAWYLGWIARSASCWPAARSCCCSCCRIGDDTRCNRSFGKPWGGAGDNGAGRDPDRALWRNNRMAIPYGIRLSRSSCQGFRNRRCRSCDRHCESLSDQFVSWSFREPGDDPQRRHDGGIVWRRTALAHTVDFGVACSECWQSCRSARSAGRACQLSLALRSRWSVGHDGLSD